MSDNPDIVITGGRIVDGTGAPSFEADLRISGGKIAEVRRGISTAGARVIKADGLYVAPGFIDTHSHADLTLMLNPQADSMVRQGFTTSIIGLCGISGGPVSKEKLSDWKAALSGVVAHYAVSVPQVSWNWESLGGYLKELKKGGISLNVGTFVGASTVRTSVIGVTNREPTKDELEKMKGLVEQSMKEGAFGLTVGLDFAPGNAAKKEEILELSKVVGDYGGLYCSHQRNGSDKLEDATRESIEIADESGSRLIISHMVPKMGGWGKGPGLIKMVEDARARGMDVVFDDYYETGSPVSLLTLLPAWAFEGGTDAMLDRLSDPGSRERIKKEFTGPLATVVRSGRWDLITVTSANKNKEFVGRTIADISTEKGKDPWDFALDLLAEERGTVEFVTFFRSAEDAKLMITHPYSLIETDTCTAAPYGPLAKLKDFKAYNLYPKLLRTYVREQKLLTLEEFVRKTTSFPAQVFGLKDRGVIREGAWADLVILDPVRVSETGTFADPAHYPVGIEYVLVNGVLVVDQEKHTGALPGVVLLSGLGRKGHRPVDPAHTALA
ncbi:MAG: D-aminoacylase [Thaumarchaeota archaeon]|nr:D-aminoacylase [Nitrososphaerota archaeon]